MAAEVVFEAGSIAFDIVGADVPVQSPQHVSIDSIVFFIMGVELEVLN